MIRKRVICKFGLWDTRSRECHLVLRRPVSMSWIFAAIGLTVIILVLLDVVVTTLTMEGAGPVANPVSHFTWRCFRRLDTLFNNVWLRMMSGPLTLIMLV